MKIENKKAFHDYEIIEQYEAGLMLESWEVKAVAKNVCSIIGAHCKVMGRDVVMLGSSMGSTPNDQFRTRKLLLHKKEIMRLIGKVNENGLTLIPLSIIMKNGKFKLNIGLCKGKKAHDKRDTEKKRSIEDENRRIVKSQKFAE